LAEQIHGEARDERRVSTTPAHRDPRAVRDLAQAHRQHPSRHESARGDGASIVAGFDLCRDPQNHQQAAALKLLSEDIEVVKDAAEDVILEASARIGEEIAKIPKASGRPTKNITTAGKNNSRKEAMPSGTQRSRYQKLAAAKPELKAIVQKLREQGKDATPTAVVRELTQGEQERTARHPRGRAGDKNPGAARQEVRGDPRRPGVALRTLVARNRHGSGGEQPLFDQRHRRHRKP
jgi:hypothetical protein